VPGCGCGFDLRVIERTSRGARCQVRDAGKRRDANAHVPECDDFMHGAHPDGMGAEQAKHPYFGRCLVLGPKHTRVYAVAESYAGLVACGMKHRSELGVVRVSHVGKPRSKSLVVGSNEWGDARQVQVIPDHHQVTRSPSRVERASSVGQKHALRAKARHGPHSVDYPIDRMALVEVEATLHAND